MPSNDYIGGTSCPTVQGQPTSISRRIEEAEAQPTVAGYLASLRGLSAAQIAKKIRSTSKERVSSILANRAQYATDRERAEIAKVIGCKESDLTEKSTPASRAKLLQRY